MQNFDNDQINMLKGIIESLLFVSEKPVTIDQIKKVLDHLTPTDIKELIKIINDEAQTKQSGLVVFEIAGGYQMLSNPKYASYLRSFFKTKHKEKLSKPALETLAIVAYKQPVTRGEIEIIRGVDSDGVVTHLVEKELIKIVGRKDVPGRPFVYGTTKLFLEYFGLRSLEDLPNLAEFPDLVKKQDASIIEGDIIENVSADSAEKTVVASVEVKEDIINNTEVNDNEPKETAA